jgi:RNA polymerase sigma-70 factor (ECF subfamily)
VAEQADPVERAFRDSAGIAVATLARLFGDIDLAEEAVQEAFAVAADRWPRDGVPPNPGGWIVTTARNRGLDRLRRESSRHGREQEAHSMLLLRAVPDPDLTEVGPVRDDQLRLIFTCCHPALAPEAQIALTLRLIAGLQVPEIARAFLVTEPTVAQRLVRAKKKIRDAGIPYRVPRDEELPDRLPFVLTVLYLVFNEGYSASSGSSLVRVGLCAEAVRLARLLVALMPDEPEVLGLLALLLLTEARRPARISPSGALVRLADQDRSSWDWAMVAEGQGIVRDLVRRNQPGPYQIQAAIAAVHDAAPVAAETNWAQVVALYDQLLAVMPTPVVALNRAVAVAELSGAAQGLCLVDELGAAEVSGPATATGRGSGTQAGLAEYHLYHATRAELLRRLGRTAESAAAYQAAITRVGNDAEREFLAHRLRSLETGR